MATFSPPGPPTLNPMNSLCLARDDVYHPVSQAYPAISPPSFPSRSGSLIQINCHAEGSLTEQSYVSPFRWTKGNLYKSCQRRVTIDVLPDDVLLEIFDCYMKNNAHLNLNAWHALVHVSRNWRCIVFNSSRRLNLRLDCSERTPAREMLDIWPPLPITVQYDFMPWNENGDNIIAALEHHDRVCDIDLYHIPSSLLEKLFVAMQGPFLALESLYFGTPGDMAPVVPDSFLGGSAPHLRVLSLEGIPFPFPGLRKLLLSATDLVQLSLQKIPHSGYFSPEAIVTCLSALTRLETVQITFKSPRSRPYRENRRPPPPPRTHLPALRSLMFKGVSEYLEDLVVRIDAPLLNQLDMSFFHQLIFDTPQLAQFINRNSRTQRDELTKEARVTFYNRGVVVRLPGPLADRLELGISCGQLDWQVSALEQGFRSSLPQALISTVEHLFIDGYDEYWWPRGQDDTDDSQWLVLLHPFIGVKNLFLSRDLAPRIARALQELVGERVYDVLPALQSINLEGLESSGVAPEGIGHFVDARHVSSHPVAIVPWNKA